MWDTDQRETGDDWKKNGYVWTGVMKFNEIVKPTQSSFFDIWNQPKNFNDSCTILVPGVFSLQNYHTIAIKFDPTNSQVIFSWPPRCLPFTGSDSVRPSPVGSEDSPEVSANPGLRRGNSWGVRRITSHRIHVWYIYIYPNAQCMVYLPTFG